MKTALDKEIGLIVMSSGKLQDRNTRSKLNRFFERVMGKVIHETPCSVVVTRSRFIHRTTGQKIMKIH